MIWFTECKFFPSAISQSQLTKVSNYELCAYMEQGDLNHIINVNEGTAIILLMDSKKDNSKCFSKLLDCMLS